MHIDSREKTVIPHHPEVRAHARTHLLELDHETFRVHFNRKPFLFRHNLSNHSLFQLEKLAELTRSLPPDIVEHNAGDVPVSLSDREYAPCTGQSVEENARRIKERGAWLDLKRVEHVPECLSLLNQSLDEVQPFSEPIEPGMCERGGAISVSSPASISPFHMDHEINFLLQIRGSRTVSVFSALDREVLSERELEDYFSSLAIHRNQAFSDRYQKRASVFELRQGFALHIPSTAPHWAGNGDAVSISFNISFKTRASMRRGWVYNMNDRLRKLGLRPAPYGRSALRDTLKGQAFRALSRAERWLGGPSS